MPRARHAGDGFRFQVLKDGDQVRLFSKSGAEYTDRLPRIVKWFKHLRSTSAVLDGELIYAGTDGRPRFYKLLYEMRTRWPDEDRMIYFVFDLLHEDGADLRSFPLTERKSRLDRLCRRSKISIMKQVLTFPDGTILIEHCAWLGFEGVVAKKADRPYVSGPSKAWAKTICPGWKRENQHRFELFQGR